MQQPHIHPARLLPLTTAVLLAIAAWPGALHAQSQEPSAKLETVVVTANKRAQNLQDVPAAITVLNDATLERANVRDLEDLPSLSPALTLSYGTQPGNFSINMRGIGTYSLGIGVEADVSVIIDDVPIGMQAGAFKDLADVFRIEVLKGPQSTLFGKSAIAGAVNITTKPISGAMRGKTTLLATNDKEWRAGASLSGAVTESLRARIALSKTNYDGPLHNLATGRDVNGSRADNVSAKLEWQPSDELTVTFSPRYNRTEKFCCSSAYTSMTPGGFYRNVPQLPQSVVLAGIATVPGNINVRNDYPTGGKFHDAGAGLKFNYAFAPDSALAGYSVDSISSYSKYHMDDYQDNDNTDVDILQYLKLPDGVTPTGMHGGLYQYGFFDVESTTQEFRLTSPDRGPLRYVVGLWYGKNELARQLIKAPLIQNAGTAYGAEAWNINKAIFGQTSWDFLPSSSLIAGLRLNREDTGYNFHRYTVPPQTFAQTEFYTKSDSNNSRTGKLGLEHRPDADHMLYAMVSTGHKGVAYDLTSGFTAALAAKPAVPAETARNIELGWKATLLQNRAMLNVAVYRTDFKHFQQSAGFFDYDGVFRTSLNSLGALRAQGVEVDGSFKVSRELLLNGSFAYNEATIVEFENGPCYNILNAAGTGAVSAPGCEVSPKYNNTKVQNLAGKPLPNAPKIKVNLGFQYDVALPSSRFDAFMTGAWRFQSRTLFALSQDPLQVQGAYGIANLGFGIKDRKDRFKLSMFVNNLFDKRYAAGLNSSIASTNWSAAAANPNKAVTITEWMPPRDYRRYFGLRLDLGF